MAKQVAPVQVKESAHSYWLYEDGSSFWGTGVWHGEWPVRITEELHKKSVEEKKIWYTNYMKKKAEEAKAKADEEAKRKQEARKG